MHRIMYVITTLDTHGDNTCWYLKITNFIPETMQCAEYKVNKKIINRTSFCTVTPAQHHVKLTVGWKMTYNENRSWDEICWSYNQYYSDTMDNDYGFSQPSNMLCRRFISSWLQICKRDMRSGTHKQFLFWSWTVLSTVVLSALVNECAWPI